MCVGVLFALYSNNVELGHHWVIPDGLSYGRHQGVFVPLKAVRLPSMLRTAAHLGCIFNTKTTRRLF